jgi:hypothetical protein
VDVGCAVGNEISGYHTTGWIATGTTGHPLALRRADPFLAVQVRAVSTVTAVFYCVSGAGVDLVRR